MLNYSIMPLNEKHIDEYCEDIKCQVENGICTMPLFSMTLTPEGDPAIDKAEIYCTIYEKYKAKLDAMGLPSGVLIQASIGHGGKLNESTPFQRFTKLSDGDSYETTCPLDEGFRAYIRRSAARIAATSPCHIMLDDDFRLLQRGGCGCPLHMAELNRRLGTDMTREELYGALCVSDEYRAEYIGLQIDSLISCAREIRAGIDSVDPTIPGSYCTCGNGAEGAYEIAAVMAGAGNPVTVRLNNANYCARDPRDFSYIMYRAATQRAAMTKDADVYLAETDTCPHNRYSTPASKLHSHFTFSILEGAAGAKHWLTRTRAYEPKSGRAYRQKLMKYKGFYDKLSELTPELTWLGCKIPVPGTPNFSLTPKDPVSQGQGWHTRVLDRFGLPMHFSRNGKGVCFFDGITANRFTGDELKEYLSGSVVLDADAAECMIKKGLGKYLGVNVEKRLPTDSAASGEIFYPSGESTSQPSVRRLTPLSDKVKRYSDVYHLRDGKYRDIMFPGVTCYENELGGTVVVFAGTSSFDVKWNVAFGMLNESRKGQLIGILTDLNALPIYYSGDAELLMKAAEMKDGAHFCAALNMSLDILDELELVIDREVNEILRINADGRYEKVEFSRGGNEYTLSLTANPFDSIALIIK